MQRARADGHACGARRPRRRSIRRPSMPTSSSAPGGAIPIEAEADERAVMLVGGEAELDGQPLDLFTLYVLRPGHAARLSSASGGRLMLMGGAGLRDAALRLLELRLLVARPDQPGEGGLEGAALPADPRRRPGVHPAARGADDGQLSVTEFRRVALRTGVTLNVALAGDPANARGHPAPRLSGIAPDLARGRAAARRTTSAWSCPTSAALPGPTGRRTSRPTRPTSWSTTSSRSPTRSGSRASRWSATTGAARSPGPRRCAATRG